MRIWRLDLFSQLFFADWQWGTKEFPCFFFSPLSSLPSHRLKKKQMAGDNVLTIQRRDRPREGREKGRKERGTWIPFRSFPSARSSLDFVLPSPPRSLPMRESRARVHGRKRAYFTWNGEFPSQPPLGLPMPPSPPTHSSFFPCFPHKRPLATKGDEETVCSFCSVPPARGRRERKGDGQRERESKRRSGVKGERREDLAKKGGGRGGRGKGEAYVQNVRREEGGSSGGGGGSSGG